MECQNLRRVIVNMPHEALVPRISAEETGLTLRIAAAMQLFAIGHFATGAAAPLSGIPRIVFLSRLTMYHNDTLQPTHEELIEEVRFAWSQ
jgi:hypothetical protein